jgi:hypothetical protein
LQDDNALLVGCLIKASDGNRQTVSRVRSLLLSGGDLCTHAALAIGAFCPLLQTLEFNNVRVNSISFEAMVSGCPLLEPFHADRYSVDERMLFALGKSCPQLRSLTCDRCLEVEDSGLIALARGCKDLRHLDVTRSSVSDEGVRFLLECCRRITYLFVNECELVSDVAFVRLPALLSEKDECKRARLKSLEVYNTACEAMSMQYLQEHCANTAMFFSVDAADEDGWY